MGLCSSKSKTGATNPNTHRPRSRSDEPNIVYTKSPAPEVQIPARKPPPPPSPKRVYKSDTILGKPFEDVKQHYTMGKELGRGQFGVTYLCTHKSTGQRYACKSILKKKLVTKGDKDDMRKEIQIMQHLSGQANIVEFKGAYEDKQSVHLVMEVCEGGELFDRIIAKGHYSERAAASICRSIVNVVHVCHFMGVMHRDLKPENFLLSDKSENALLKATDFGLSVFIQEERSILGNVVFHRYCSSILFMASMTRTTDLEAIMEQHKTEVVATIAATAKRLDQMQEMIEKKIEKNKAETDKQIAEVLQLLKALQPPTTTAAATSQSIPQPPSTFTLINPLPPPRHTTPMPPPTHPLSQPIVTQPPADSNLILNQKSTEGIPNLQEELQETRSKSDSYGDTQPNPNDSLPLEIVSRGFTSSDKKVVQGKITNLSHDNLVVTTSIREKGEWLVNGHLKLPSSLSLLLLPPLGVIDVKCWNQFQFDFFPP